MEELPAEIGSLRKLKTINVSDNRLRSLPAEFYTLVELCELHFKSNDISVLEEEIGSLVMLTHVVNMYILYKLHVAHTIIICIKMEN